MFENTNLSIEYRKDFNQKILLSSCENVNLIHEILRQGFHLNVHDSTIKQCLEMYKKWFLREATLPFFINDSLNQKQLFVNKEPNLNVNKPPLNDSNIDVKVGFIRCLQMFFVDSSIIFFNRINLQRDRIIDTCVCLLDTIKLFMKKIQMDQSTW